MTSTPIIRTLALEDIFQVTELGLKNFVWHSENLLWNKQMVEWYLQFGSDLSYVAIKENSILGFILCSSVKEKGYIGWILVDSNWRRKGIGGKLMHRAILSFYARGIKTVISSVREDNQANILFAQSGFKDTGLKKIDMLLEFENRTNSEDKKE